MRCVKVVVVLALLFSGTQSFAWCEPAVKDLQREILFLDSVVRAAHLSSRFGIDRGTSTVKPDYQPHYNRHGREFTEDEKYIDALNRFVIPLTFYINPISHLGTDVSKRYLPLRYRVISLPFASIADYEYGYRKAHELTDAILGRQVIEEVARVVEEAIEQAEYSIEEVGMFAAQTTWAGIVPHLDNIHDAVMGGVGGHLLADDQEVSVLLARARGVIESSDIEKLLPEMQEFLRKSVERLEQEYSNQ